MFKRHVVETPKTVEGKLDVIILHLERMDRRDRARMWGSYVHSLLTLIPMLFFIWSTWYFYAHFDDIMGMMMQQTAQKAANATGQGYDDVLKQIREAFGVGAKKQ